MKLKFLSLIIAFTSHALLSQTYNYYFGNLHSHTGFSDGCKDSTSSNVTNPTGAYAFAKQSNNFDFLGVSEHNHYSSANNPGFKIQSYSIGLNMANTANQDGVFLTLFGNEYGVSSSYNGHVVVYGFNQLIGWETTVPGVVGNNYNIYNAKSDYDGLFKKVKNNPAAFCYLAHPQYSDYSTVGTAASALLNLPYNAAYDSAIVGTPLRSGLAFSTFINYNDYPAGNYFQYYKNLLAIGYHVGIGYDHDNHYTTFGRSTGGRLVILAPSLTRANLYTAMQSMHFYGSDDMNAKVAFTMGTNIMGSILTGSANPTFNVTHNDLDGELADTIKIWRGVSNSGGVFPTPINTSLASNTSIFTDNSGLVNNIQYYYFAEIKQADGQWIVTSPIWYTKSASVGIKEIEPSFEFNYFPNPVSQKLNISFTQNDLYKISIIDITGRVVYQTNGLLQKTEIDLSAFNQGIYSLKVENKNTSTTKKLIVE